MRIGMIGLGRMGAIWFAVFCATAINALSSTGTRIPSGTWGRTARPESRHSMIS